MTIGGKKLKHLITHRIDGNRKRSKQSTNADQKLLETVFTIVICCQLGDKWQSKTLSLTIFALRSSIVLTFFIAAHHLQQNSTMKKRTFW